MNRAKEAETRLNEKMPELTDAMKRGERARAILDDPMFKEAVRATRDGAIREFTTSSLKDDDARLKARLKVDILTSVVNELSRHMTKGAAAEKQLGMLRAALTAAKQRLIRRVA